METEAGKKKATESYRVYLSPEVVAAIRKTADELGVSHTKLAAVWLAETVHRKRAELGFASSMQEQLALIAAQAMGEASAEETEAA